jgi:protein disulfide-isomerase-like protein
MINRFKDYDFYRNIPKDLTESTYHGFVLSVCASVFMVVLFTCELWAFLTQTTLSHVIIDPSTESLLQINFNITVMDIPCEFAVIDVIDVLGTRKDNITKYINKWGIDASGVKRNYEGRNTEQKDIMHDNHHDIKELLANGLHATPLDGESYQPWLHDHQYTFVDFYAPWCSWCQRLEPVWEAFAEQMEHEDLPISVVKVDCDVNQAVCMNEKIMAFPSLRLFKDGIAQPPEYRGDRTLDALTGYIRETLREELKVASMNHVALAEHKEKKELERTDHPGCLLSGFLKVNRVPGNFHIESRSKIHNLNPAMANVSHTVNHLSFGPILSKSTIRKIEGMPKDMFDFKNTNSMDGYAYMTGELHQAYHHYIKAISSTLQPSLKYSGSQSILTYQMVQSSQVMQVMMMMMMMLFS